MTATDDDKYVIIAMDKPTIDVGKRNPIRLVARKEKPFLTHKEAIINQQVLNKAYGHETHYIIAKVIKHDE